MSEQMTAAEFRAEHKSAAAQSDADSEMTAAAFQDKYGQAKNERQLQKNVCKWLDAADIPYFAVPNGQMRAGQAMEPGMQKGVPDLCIPLPTESYPSLYIELKQPRKYVRKSQQEWLDDLTDLGHACTVCRSLDDVIATVREYQHGTIDDKALWPHQR